MTEKYNLNSYLFNDTNNEKKHSTKYRGNIFGPVA